MSQYPRINMTNFPLNDPGSRRVVPRRNPRRDMTRRECRSTPIPQEPMSRVQHSRRVATDPVASPNFTAPATRSLTPALHFTRTPSFSPPTPEDPEPKVAFKKVTWDAKAGQKPKAAWNPPSPTTLPISFNTKPAPPRRRSAFSSFFRCLCCFR